MTEAWKRSHAGVAQRSSHNTRDNRASPASPHMTWRCPAQRGAPLVEEIGGEEDRNCQRIAVERQRQCDRPSRRAAAWSRLLRAANNAARRCAGSSIAAGRNGWPRASVGRRRGHQQLAGPERSLRAPQCAPELKIVVDAAAPPACNVDPIERVTPQRHRAAPSEVEAPRSRQGGDRGIGHANEGRRQSVVGQISQR